MKNILKKITMLSVLLSFFAFSGCDELSDLTVNIPLEIAFDVRGNSDSPNNSKNFRLSQYEAWREHQEDVESAKFLKASYWTISASPNLTADLQFSLSTGSGEPLFTFLMNNIVADDYKDKAYELKLTDGQIEALDNYLSDLSESDKSFKGNLSVTNIKGSMPFQLIGKVEIVLETEVKTDLQ